MHHEASSIALLILVSATACTASAQSARFERDCQKWIGEKGYSSDYVERRTGKRQPGLASEWRGNRDVDKAEVGDVALIRLPTPGAQHAAVVEEVRRDAAGRVAALRVSEWNWGKTVDARCLVTENFGKLAPARWVPKEAIAAVWHPQ